MNARALGIALTATAVVFSAAVRAAEYRIDPAHSFVQFKISHLWGYPG